MKRQTFRLEDGSTVTLEGDWTVEEPKPKKTFGDFLEAMSEFDFFSEEGFSRDYLIELIRRNAESRDLRTLCLGAFRFGQLWLKEKNGEKDV